MPITMTDIQLIAILLVVGGGCWLFGAGGGFYAGYRKAEEASMPNAKSD